MSRPSQDERLRNSLYRKAFERFFSDHPLMRLLPAYEADPIFGVWHVYKFNPTLRQKQSNQTSPYHFDIRSDHAYGLIARSQMMKLLMERFFCHPRIGQFSRDNMRFANKVMSRVFFRYFNSRKFLAMHASSLFREGLSQLCCKHSLSGAIRNFALAGIYGCKPAILQLIRLLEENRFAVGFWSGIPNFYENRNFVVELKKLL